MIRDTSATECCEICHSCSRLLKNAVKLSNSNGGNFSRSRGFSRRINVNLPASPLNFDKCSSTHNDKENMGCGTGGSSTGVAPEADILPFSQHNSPSKQIASPSKFSLLKHAVSPLRQRHPLEDQDPNSQDSGYGAFLDKDEAKSGFRFAEPSGLAPRKFSIEQSPRKENSPLKSPRSKSRGHLNPPLFHSLSSGSESADDGFTDLLDLEKVEDGVHLPSGISSLLSGPIIRDHTTILKQNVSPKEERPRSSFQRSQSLIENHTPSSSKVRSCLFKSASSSNATEPDAEYEIDSLRSFKRPEPPCEIAPPMQSKRRKSSSLHSIGENVPTPGSSSLQRSFSESEATIKRALLRSSQIPDLIGDFSRPFLLPLMEGRHQDLKTISADTLASLMSGDYDDEVESYSVIDCRYPYEFDGGHIKGAKNIYTKEQIFKEFVDIKPAKTTETTQNSETNSSKRNILIFHCEFSSERGPNMFRFLRKTDRDQNGDSYPALNYPELYLLHGGYKTFFEKHSDKCEPCAYRPMLDPNHETDLRHFRSKSKSWNGDSKSRQAFRNTLKRLGL